MNTFPKTDLARLAKLPAPFRALALVAALRFVAAPDLIFAGVETADVDKLLEQGCLFRLPLQRRLTDAHRVDVLALRRKGALELAAHLDVAPESVSYSTRTTCDRSAMFLDHRLAISRFALLLARDLRNGVPPAALLSWEMDPDRLADAVHVLGGPDESLLIQRLEALLRRVRKERSNLSFLRGEGLLDHIVRIVEVVAVTLVAETCAGD